MVVTVSHLGYVKRVPLSTYRAQRRGGKGRSGMQTREEDFVTRLFVANTHQPVLYFSSHGRVYKQKVWKLPLAAPQARGKALINILPLDQGETINTIMPLPEDEATWDKLDVMFATTRGSVRRNKLSDFADVRPSGIIAMKIDEGEGIVGVQICTETDDVLLTASGGQCIRFAVPEVRVFAGRTSMGVRGINLEEGDKVISLSILRHVDATADERGAFLKQSAAIRRAETGEEAEPAEAGTEAEEADVGVALSLERYVGAGCQAAVRADRFRKGHGQALIVVPVPHHRTRRQRHRRDGDHAQDRQARGLVPGRGRRPDHAGDQSRPAHPHARRRHPHRGPLDARA